MLLFLVTPCLVVAVQPCMEWIPIDDDDDDDDDDDNNNNNIIIMIIRPTIVNYLFIVTCPHRKNLPQNAAWKLIIWSWMEKKHFCKKQKFQEYKTRQII